MEAQVDKKNIIGIIAVLVLAIIVVWFLLSEKSGEEEQFLPEPEETVQDDHQEVEQRLKELGPEDDAEPLSGQDHQEIEQRLRELQK